MNDMDDDWMVYADDDDDNTTIINSSWCKNRSGVCLSFAIPIEVMSVTEINEYGKEFMRAVKDSYKRMIDDYFYAKTETPVISSTYNGEIIMIWSFQGDNDESTVKALKDSGIKEIKY